MAFDIKIETFETGTDPKSPKWTLEKDKGGLVTFEQIVDFANTSLILVAEDALDEEQRAGRFPRKGYIEITDGKVGKPYSAVDIRKKGQIEFAQPILLEDYLRTLFKIVLQLSPVDTGRYKNSHLLMWRKQVVASNPEEAIAWARKNGSKIQNNDFITLVNYMPYARKLERYGVTSDHRRVVKTTSRKRAGGITEQIKKPNGVYFLASRALLRAFPKSAGNIRFQFLSGQGMPFPPTTMRSSFVKDGRPYVYPSISLRIDLGGIR